MPTAHDMPWMLVPVVVPLTMSLATFLLGGWWGMRLGLVTAGAVVAAAAAITGHVWQNGPQMYPLGNWPAPLGIELYADGLTCVMLWMSGIVGSFVSVYATGYFEVNQGVTEGKPDRSSVFWAQWLLLWCALHALFLSRDVFNLYVTLELMTLSAIGLIVLAGTRAAVEAALNYLLAALVGSLLYLAGIALMYGMGGTLDIVLLRTELTTDGTLRVAAILVMLGLMLKSALFPFHFWLPTAHGSAPAPVSAVLSALVVKGAFYILLRLWFELLPDDLLRPVSPLPAMLGAVAILWGSFHAMFAERLKTLVAYSTVAQLGYLFLAFDLARLDNASGQTAWSGCILFALAHALAKGALFLATGAVLHVAGHDRIRELAAVSRRTPVTFFAIAMASVSLMGLPPTGAFVAKWMLLKVAFESGQYGLAAVILVGGVLAAAYLFRVLSAAFQEPEREIPELRAAPFMLQCSALGLAFAGLLLGTVTAPITELLEIGSPWAATVQEVSP